MPNVLHAAPVTGTDFPSKKPGPCKLLRTCTYGEYRSRYKSRKRREGTSSPYLLHPSLAVPQEISYCSIVPNYPISLQYEFPRPPISSPLDLVTPFSRIPPTTLSFLHVYYNISIFWCAGEAIRLHGIVPLLRAQGKTKGCGNRQAEERATRIENLTYFPAKGRERRAAIFGHIWPYPFSFPFPFPFISIFFSL